MICTPALRPTTLKAVTTTALLTLALALAPPVLAQAAAPRGGADGLWLNPKGSVAVQTAACGPALCGRVVWASAEAKADARDSGVSNLLGTELLQDYRASGGGVWKGTVFVPDMGRRFTSEIDAVSANAIKVKGCILGGLVCRSQVWTRLRQLPA